MSAFPGGAVSLDISGCVIDGREASIALANIRKYMAAMNERGRKPSAIAVRSADYSRLVRAAAKSRGLQPEEVSGLTYDGIRVRAA